MLSDPLWPFWSTLTAPAELHHSPQNVPPMSLWLNKLIDDWNSGQEWNGLKIRAHVEDMCRCQSHICSLCLFIKMFHKWNQRQQKKYNCHGFTLFTGIFGTPSTGKAFWKTKCAPWLQKDRFMWFGINVRMRSKNSQPFADNYKYYQHTCNLHCWHIWHEAVPVCDTILSPVPYQKSTSCQNQITPYS